MHDLSLLSITLLCAVAFAAGWVDAVSGGGGLMQLPALFIALPQGSEVNALGTNKLSSIFGTTMAARTFARSIVPDWSTAIPMAGVAFIFSALGAATAHAVPEDIFGGIVVVALTVVWIFTAVNPHMGSVTHRRWQRSRQHVTIAMITGAFIGFYDGIFGPGTGSFLLIALVGLFGYSFLAASAMAKFVNLGTNAAALIVFGITGSVFWLLGVLMGGFNVLGAFLGARSAIRRGSQFVRVVFLLLVAGLIFRLVWDITSQ